MPSTKFKSLKQNVRLLRRHLLPSKFDPTGTYRDRVFTGVVAFRVLCHAEIEDYFEFRAIEIARSALLQCRSSGKVSLPAISLVGFSGHEHKLPPDTIDPPDPSMSRSWPSAIEIKQRLNDCTANFIGRITRENHGIREKNILSMLIPIGVDPGNIDRLFLSEIDNFGSVRGEYAHQSPMVHTITHPDPKSEYQKIMGLLSMIEPIDRNLDDLLALTKTA